MVDKKVLTRNLRLIENYPYDGVIYCDSSTLFTDADCLEEMVSAFFLDTLCPSQHSNI